MTPRSKPLCYKYITKNFKPTRHKTKFQIPTEATSTTISQPKGQPVRNTFSRGHGFFRSSKTSAGLSFSLSVSLSLPLKICVLDSRGHKSQALLQPRQGLAAVLSRPRFNRAVYPRACSRSSQHLSTTIDGYVNR